ncbi:MAG TPA: 50S ribosomal protein L11 methyltransferase [Gammaproteobacteria bacterium]|nr:50S ribosomal protein L11 methyltransferase [Gammaproteobacteria bacterium]
MPWLQLHFDTSRDQAEALSATLSALGAQAVTLGDAADEALLEPPPGAAPLWSKVVVTALFASGTQAEDIIAKVEALLGPAPPCRKEQLEDQAWERAWLEHFQPMRFGERLWVCPREQGPVEPDGVNILLDPGLAFGTGTHATTALCLNWLDAHPPRGKTVIDYGCGSGILAIAAARLGAAQVRAVDHDSQALQATCDNALVNRVAERIATHSPADFPHVPADLLLANILAGPLIELAPRFAALLRPGGDIVLSGILAEQKQAVVDVYQLHFRLHPPVEQQGWVRLWGKRR